MESQEANKVQELKVMFAASGKPFKTEKAAMSAATQKNLRDYTIVPYPTHENPHGTDSYVIKVGKNGEEPTNQRVEPNQPEPNLESYHRVRFQAKGSPNDPEDVTLAVNGETLILQREKEVVIPQRFRECADHGTYPQFRQMPGEPRKVVAHIKVFPYDYLGLSTEAEFKKQIAEGNRKTKDNIRKYGYNVRPEDV